MPCDLNHGGDQRQILDAVSAVLDSRFPLARLRGGTPDDLTPLSELGVFDLTLPVESGGAGFSLVEEALVHRLLGRHLVSIKALAAALAPRLAATQRNEKGIRDTGHATCCVGFDSTSAVLLLEASGARFATVFDRAGIVLADIPEGLTSRAGLGGTAEVMTVSHSALTRHGGGNADVRRIGDLLACAQLVGIAEAARDLAVAYAQMRHQFGRPIGSFQAIKHHCANMAIAAEAASAQLDVAAIAERDARIDAPFQVAALCRVAERAALANARTCIQVHGGIGFSAEVEAHRLLKQAHALRNLLSGLSLLDLSAPLAPLGPPFGAA